MAIDPLLPPDPPEPPEPPAPTRRKLVCEFCECPLAPSGEFLKLSEKAKAFRHQDDRIDQLHADLVSVREDVTAALKERDEARALVPKKSSFWS